MNPCALPVTGTELLPLVTVAIVLLLAGAAAVLLATRRRGRAWLSTLAIVGIVAAGLTVAPALPASAADCTSTPPATAPVNTAPVAVPDAAGIVEDGEGDTVTGDLLVDDTDADGDTLVVTTVGTFTLTYGTIVVASDGSYTYTLDNANPALGALDDGQTVTDTFAYTISDGRGGTASASLTITITGTTDNRAPTANPDAVSIKEDTAPNPVSGNVLTNDTDPDGHTLSVTNAGTVTLSYGTLVINADGSFSYTLNNANPAVNALNNGQTLVDSFTYAISDGHGGSASGVLTITINGTADNTAPTATGDTNSVKEDTAPNPISGNVLTNDSDPDGHTLSVTNPGTFTLAHGVLVINADGTYTFTLDNSNPAVNALNNGQTLVDSFAYAISDGRGGTASAQLAITINGTTDNAEPLVEADTNTITEDAPPGVVAGNVLTNDSDPDGNTLSVANAGTVTLTYGSLEIHADGSYTYTLDNSNPVVNALNDGQHLTDTFTYTASDGHGGTSSSTLTIRIEGTTDAVP